jgi:hypothetical protein
MTESLVPMLQFGVFEINKGTVGLDADHFSLDHHSGMQDFLFFMSWSIIMPIIVLVVVMVSTTRRWRFLMSSRVTIAVVVIVRLMVLSPISIFSDSPKLVPLFL